MDTKSGDGDAQEVDIGDVEVSAEPVARRMTAPPPLPPGLAAPSPAAAVAAMPGPVGGASAAPGKQRGPVFFVGLLLAVLVVGLGAGAAVMLSGRKAPSAAPPSSASPAPAVITIPTVDMDDEPADSGR